MKKVVKISIGNLAFTVEEDGFLLIKGYLGEIQDHYQSNENGREIVEGIEERMAELFLEKAPAGSVVTISIVKEVIAILGRPSAIDQEQGDVRSASSSYNYKRVPKKLYRNGQDKVLGGVCSGLAAYSSLDVALVRILFVILLIGFSFFGLIHIGGGSFMIIAYIIMWIVIPQARTVEQRCAMFGEPMDLSYINQKIGKGATNQSSGALKGLGRLLSIVFSVLLIIISVSGLATLSFSLFGLEVFKGVIPINMLDYLYLGVENGLFLKIAIISFLTLPFLGMLYGGIQLLFRFKTTRVRPGLIILLLWIISLFAVIFYTVKSTRPYWDSAEYSGQITLNQEVDTIYVRFISKTPMPEERVLLSADYSDFFVSWMDNNRELVVFPNLRIVRQSPKAERVLKYRTYAHANSYSSALVKAQRAVPSIQIKDSVITISPKYYNRQQKWDGLSQEISLNIPESVIIIVEEPLQHSFNKVIRKEGIFRFHKWERNFERKFDNWEHRFERKLDRFEDRIERFEERFD